MNKFDYLDLAQKCADRTLWDDISSEVSTKQEVSKLLFKFVFIFLYF